MDHILPLEIVVRARAYELEYELPELSVIDFIGELYEDGWISWPLLCGRCGMPEPAHAADKSCYTSGPEKFRP